MHAETDGEELDDTLNDTDADEEGLESDVTDGFEEADVEVLTDTDGEVDGLSDDPADAVKDDVSDSLAHRDGESDGEELEELRTVATVKVGEEEPENDSDAVDDTL